MNRKIFAFSVSILVVSAFAYASGDDVDPLEIIKKADAALEDITAVSYTAKSTPGGIATNFVTAAEGEAIVMGWRDDWNFPEKFFVHIKTTKRGTGEPLEVTGGGDGDMFFLVDHTTKKGYEDMDPAVMGSSAFTLSSFGMQEYVRANPFEDEMNGTLKYEGTEAVGGEECYKIHVEYAQAGQSSTWFFGMEDYLPRRRVQHFSMGNQGEGSLTIELANLAINPQLDAATFRMKLPADYEQIDDFAP